MHYFSVNTLFMWVLYSLLRKIHEKLVNDASQKEYKSIFVLVAQDTFCISYNCVPKCWIKEWICIINLQTDYNIFCFIVRKIQNDNYYLDEMFVKLNYPHSATRCFIKF